MSLLNMYKHNYMYKYTFYRWQKHNPVSVYVIGEPWHNILLDGYLCLCIMHILHMDADTIYLWKCVSFSVESLYQYNYIVMDLA